METRTLTVMNGVEVYGLSQEARCKMVRFKEEEKTCDGVGKT